MEKTLKQLADEIGVSKQAIYKKIHKEPLATEIKELSQIVNGTVYINDKGQRLIKSTFLNKSAKTVADNGICSTDIQVYELLKENFEVLQKQLEVKDLQIEELKRLLDQEQQINMINHKNVLIAKEEPTKHNFFSKMKKKSKEEI